jgi:hypothetical protein
MGVFSHNPVGPGGFVYPYKIDQSCRFNDDDSAYTSKTFASAGDRSIWTFSTWFKRGNISTPMGFLCNYNNASNYAYISFDGNDIIFYETLVNGVNRGSVQIEPRLRDTSAWYHLVVSMDADNQQMRMWVNGVEYTLTVATAISASDGRMNGDVGAHYLGYRGASGYFDGYMAETYFIDGQELTASSFGESKNGIWVPINYTGGSYGTNGFYFDFSNSSHFGEDQSGNNNDFTDSGLATNDQVEDTPTNNHVTFTNFWDTKGATGNTLSDGNLKVGCLANGANNGCGSTMGAYAGKFYWEFEADAGGATPLLGAANLLEIGAYADISYPGIGGNEGANSWGYYASTGNKFNDGNQGAYGDSFTDSDIIGVAIDMDAGKIWFAKNNVWQDSGDPAAGTGEAFSNLAGCVGPHVGNGASTGTDTIILQALASHMTYTPPTGFVALNWANITAKMGLSETLYLEGNKGFDTVIYTGTGAELEISDLEFSPNFVWVKERAAVGYSHRIADSVRGATLSLESNTLGVEQTEAQGLKSFDNDGFTLGTNVAWNNSGSTFVAWNWLEDPNYGFDIVSHTGDGTNPKTVAHSLGVTPEMIITKSRSNAQKWIVGHKDLTSWAWNLYLDDTSTQQNDAQYSTPDSTNFYPNNASTNTNLATYISYLFASIEGYSKVFSYTGNASADGPFVYCGFRPRYFFVKNINQAKDWWQWDTERATYNQINQVLFPNGSGTEQDNVAYGVDIYSNGFKIRNTDASFNGSGNTMIGIAFAETPFPWANAR